MRHMILALAMLFGAASAYGQCLPPTPQPSPDFVPTSDCQGWVPASHPLAQREVKPIIQGTQAYQAIYAQLEMPTTAYGSITTLYGWAVDCQIGAFPPVITVRERKPDGSVRDVPTDYFTTFGMSRPDVRDLLRPECPNVDHPLASNGSYLSPWDRYGLQIGLRSPITEPGPHTFTLIAEWPYQGHSGSYSVTVTIR